MSREYIINGKRYTTPDDIPEDARKVMEELQGLDFDTLAARHLSEGNTENNQVYSTHSTRIVVNGEEVDSAEGLPEDVRKAMMDSGMFADKDGDGIPDVLQGDHTAIQSPAMPHQSATQRQTLSKRAAPPSHTRASASHARSGIRSKDVALKRRQTVTNIAIIAALIALGLYAFVFSPSFPQ